MRKGGPHPTCPCIKSLDVNIKVMRLKIGIEDPSIFFYQEISLQSICMKELKKEKDKKEANVIF